MRQITLTKGFITLVDDTDFENLNAHKWFAVENPKHIYAARKLFINKKHYIQYMHRQLLGILPYEKISVDHISGNGLNNQRANIRISDNFKNMQNRRIQKHSSQYKGVSWFKRDKKWRAGIKHRGKNIYLGTFQDELSAAKAYNKRASALWGEFANLNIIEQEVKA
jgi:hypothetical protein